MQAGRLSVVRRVTAVRVVSDGKFIERLATVIQGYEVRWCGSWGKT
jgi:hypothetical protein